MSTTALFKQRIPEFASMSDVIVDDYLGMAAKRVDATVFGDLYVDAAIWMAAHLMKIAYPGVAGAQGVGGAVASKTTGSQSISFNGVLSAANSLGEQSLATTSYGQQYLGIRSQCIIGPTVSSLDADY